MSTGGPILTSLCVGCKINVISRELQYVL